MKKIAIIVFVPEKEEYFRQFLSLYYSVILHADLRESADFIVGCAPDIASLIPVPNCYVAHIKDISKLVKFQFRNIDSKSYEYINSWSHFADKNSIDLILRYPYSLRIDVDTFLSPSILQASPPEGEILTGKGQYAFMQETRDHILRVAKVMNYNHRSIHNVGSTWFGHSSDIVKAGKASLKAAQYLLRHEFTESEGWPIWHSGVTTMYAAELALNNSKLKISINEKLDHPSDSDKDMNEVYAIHCWHTDQYFSKFAYASGKYATRKVPASISSCKDYAYFCSKNAELLFDLTTKGETLTGNARYMTSFQAIRAALALLRKALPYLPKDLWLKLVRKIRGR